MKNKPVLIVTSSTRNYGWITRAFLKGNTRWADYVIIIDQMSTDGTREMCAEYKNVILMDDPDMNYKENIRAKIAFEKGRELSAGRDTIFFALDIDEIMPSNWENTRDGDTILHSKPGDMFQLRWANIIPNNNFFYGGWQYKIFHDNGMDWQDLAIQMHAPLLPYSTWDVEPKEVYDFPLLHFGEYNVKWMLYKNTYYQFLDVKQKRSKSAVSIYRTYHRYKITSVIIEPIKQEWLFNDFDVFRLINTSAAPVFIQYIQEIIREEGIEKFKKIDVWSSALCKELNAIDPRTTAWKFLHNYLKYTNSYSRWLIVRIIDKMLKYIV